MNKFERKSESTRAALFEAAQKVIVEEGYERAQLETIATKAGRTKGSIYAQFKSKEELFLAMMEFVIEARRRAIGSLSLEHRGEALRLAVRSVCLHAALDDAWLMVILEFKLHAYRNPRAVERIRESYSRLWEEFHGLLLRVAPSSGRSTAEVSTCLEILRAVTPALVLEPALRPKPASAFKARRVSFERMFDLLFPSN